MAASSSQKTLFLGSFVHCKSLGELEFLHDSAVCVDEKGIIVAFEKGCDQKKVEETVYPKLGWTAGEVTVRTSQPGQFFFPGFIGLLSHSSIYLILCQPNSRYPYPRITVSQRRNLRQEHPPRLAEHLHVPHGEQLIGRRKSKESLQPCDRTNPLPRNDHRILLCHHLRTIHQPARGPLSREGTESFHRPLLHGLYGTGLLPR